MPGSDYTKQMETVVERTIEENELDAFEEYWNLSRELIAGLPVRAFYLAADEGYGNLAIVTDGSIIDIEADDDDDDLGYISVTTIESIAKVHFRAGSVPTIPNSEDAQLTIILSIAGATGSGPYWIAETDAEYQHLTRFGAALMSAINGH